MHISPRELRVNTNKSSPVSHLTIAPLLNYHNTTIPTFRHPYHSTLLLGDAALHGGQHYVWETTRLASSSSRMSHTKQKTTQSLERSPVICISESRYFTFVTRRTACPVKTKLLTTTTLVE